MTLVEESIDLTASPTDGHEDFRIERGGMTSKLGWIPETPAFVARDVVLRQPGSFSDVRLSPTKSVTQCPQSAANALVVHERSVWRR